MMETSEFAKNCKKEWSEVISKLFPDGKLSDYEWRNKYEIVKVLNMISDANGNLSCLFFASEGNGGLYSAKVYEESEEFIELSVDAIPVILMPIGLLFYSFGDNADWDYFRIEVAQVNPLFSSSDAEDEQIT
jgi:serine/threonine-protein kinase